MKESKTKIRVPFALEAIALFIIPFEELIVLSFGSLLRLINLFNIAIILITSKKIKVDMRRNSTSLPMLIFLTYCMFSVAWCFNRTLFFDRLVTYGMYILLILLLETLKPIEREKNAMIIGFFLGGILATLLLLYSSGSRLDIGGGRETISMAGRKVDANILSVSLVMTFIIAFYHLLTEKRKTILSIFVHIVLMLLLFLGLLNTGSRGSMVCAVISAGIIVMGVDYEKNVFIKKLLLVSLVCTVILYVYYHFILVSKLGSRFTLDNLIGTGEYGTSNREQIWSVAVRKILQKPIFGYGNGSSPFVIETEYKFYGTHNSYLMLLLEHGIIGFLIVFIWFKNLFLHCIMSPSKLFLFLLIALLIIVFFIEGFSTKVFWGTLILLNVCCNDKYMEEGCSSKNDKNNI